ncbi:GatB/YqeY domain-containing protein [Patescibacteria group bacterium]
MQKEAKKRKESIDAFTTGDRKDLADKESAELQLIEKYLPDQLSAEDIRAAVQEVVNELGDGQFGAVMGAAMKKLKGQADGNAVKEIVQELLQKK